MVLCERGELNNMGKKIFAILIVIIIGIVLYIIINPPIQFSTNLDCQEGDGNCIERADDLRENCIPSVTNITRETPDGSMTILINISRVGDDCIIEESIIELNLNEGEEFNPYDVKCVVPIEYIGSPYECQDSLYEKYVSESDGGGDGGGSDGGDGGEEEYISTIITIVCSIDDLQCKEIATSYIQNCRESDITDTERVWTDDSYWTKNILVEDHDQSCILYITIVDVVNPPPQIPDDIIGMELECSFPIDPVQDPPIENLTLDYCLGELFGFVYD